MFEIKLLLQNSQKFPLWWDKLPVEFSSQIKLIHSAVHDQDHLIFDGTVLSFSSGHQDHQAFAPIFFDFDQVISQFQNEFAHKSKKNELLYKAFNFKTDPHPTILDASCGTAKDALMLWFFGGKVQAFERNPVVFLLLSDALARSEVIKENFHLHYGSATMSEIKADLVYFDPMFPEKKKSALPNKEMQVFKVLVGSDEDQTSVAAKLLAKKAKRLVIKRPSDAGPILPNPSMNYESKLLRLDCYL